MTATMSFRRRTALRALAWLMIAAGVLVLADVATTLMWQEPLSALYAKLRQDRLSGELRTLDRTRPSAVARQALGQLTDERKRIAYLAWDLQRRAHSGSAVGKIAIPSIGADFVVVKGTGESELQEGPGIYPQTEFPGVSGTTAIAGHRTTYLAPFRHIDALRHGNRIVVSMPYGRFTYRVTGARVVLPSDVGVIDPVGYPELVLSACTPLFSASHRLVVFARLESVLPLGAARRGGEGAAPLRVGMGAVQVRRRLPQVLEPLQHLPLSLVA